MNQEFLSTHLNDQLLRLIISNARKKTTLYNKIVIKPFLKEGQLNFQFESFSDTQAFHENYDHETAVAKLTNIINNNDYKQYDGYETSGEWHALINKKGLATIKEKRIETTKTVDLSHNKKKHYLFEEGTPINYLVELGVMTSEGKVVKKRYDKFKQINRFIEMVADVVPSLPTDRPVNIIDFGCGKSYLTFALYHYLTFNKGLDVRITGLDLKEKVISDCNHLAQKCDYSHLSFKHGNIVDYTSTDDIDMVVTLHACDTATDLALQKAIKWHAKVIMSVPCCQHELNKTIDIKPLESLLKYGIIKERMSALLTDAMRAQWLELQGYETQILEFIDVAHTPKNLLIRAIKISDVDTTQINYKDYDDLMAYMKADLTIRKDH